MERGEDPESAEALKVRDALSGQVFARWQVDITNAAGREATRANMMVAAERMIELVTRPDAKPVRRLAMAHHRNSCTRQCDYGAWCRASMREGGATPVAVLGTDYKVRPDSPLAGHTNAAPLFNADDAYVEWAAEQGRDVAAIEEFRP